MGFFFLKLLDFGLWWSNCRPLLDQKLPWSHRIEMYNVWYFAWLHFSEVNSSYHIFFILHCQDIRIHCPVVIYNIMIRSGHTMALYGQGSWMAQCHLGSWHCLIFFMNTFITDNIVINDVFVDSKYMIAAYHIDSCSSLLASIHNFYGLTSSEVRQVLHNVD